MKVDLYIAEGGAVSLASCVNLDLVPRIAETVIIPTRPEAVFLVTAVTHDLTKDQAVNVTLRELVETVVTTAEEAP